MAARPMKNSPNFFNFSSVTLPQRLQLLYRVSQADSLFSYRNPLRAVRCLTGADALLQILSVVSKRIVTAHSVPDTDHSLQPEASCRCKSAPVTSLEAKLTNQLLFRNRCLHRDLSIYDAAVGEVLCYLSRFCPESGGNVPCQKPTNIRQAVRSPNNFHSVIFHGLCQCLQANCTVLP